MERPGARRDGRSASLVCDRTLQYGFFLFGLRIGFNNTTEIEQLFFDTLQRTKHLTHKPYAQTLRLPLHTPRGFRLARCSLEIAARQSFFVPLVEVVPSVVISTRSVSRFGYCTAQ